MRSTEEIVSDCVAVTKNGHVIYLCQVDETPTMERFQTLARAITQRTQYNYKCLVWSPRTTPNPPTI